MKKTKKIITVATMILALSATSVTAFAASKYSSPQEAVSALTGKPVEDIVAQHEETGKTYGAIAKENGVLDEFKEEKLEIKKDALSKKVADGSITQDQADKIIASIEERQQNCDGSGNNGEKLGLGLGKENKSNKNQGSGLGKNQGKGNGQRLKNGSCTNVTP